MNVSLKSRGFDGQSQALVQKIHEPVKAVVRGFIGLVDEGIGAVNDLDAHLILGQRSNVRIVFPEFRATGPDIRDKLARVPAMQIPNRGGQHDQIARRQAAFKQQFSHLR